MYALPPAADQRSCPRRYSTKTLIRPPPATVSNLVMKNPEPPRLIALFSYAGALPFLFFGGGVYSGGTELDVASGMILRTYGAVILSFIGGVQWGAIMLHSPVPRGPIVAGVMASIIAWVALLTPLSVGLGILVAGIVLQFAADVWAIRLGLLPQWYLRLRTALTVTVAGILLATAFYPALP
jgi:hypothetical protein